MGSSFKISGWMGALLGSVSRLMRFSLLFGLTDSGASWEARASVRGTWMGSSSSGNPPSWMMPMIWPRALASSAEGMLVQSQDVLMAVTGLEDSVEGSMLEMTVAGGVMSRSGLMLAAQELMYLSILRWVGYCPVSAPMSLTRV